ncbi:hypothetical protein GON03_19090 [Nocardioides sp. MAH-18]|uniref:Phage portal protein n=1 Tax=Nocardioides agri TaxID=2682843 RepID=A0A6L6XWZ0_9ACTN|nr:MULTISPECIES: hypothetical protein [unclassified Nocardioides]MBA2952123.1 hypothetical protein [Nocardioides sp. CGMCC 1.13656]MVQ51292.1 hypothetical protein [Nocardioides sp. MAH-18]
MSILDVFSRVPDTSTVGEVAQTLHTADLTEQLHQAIETIHFLEEQLVGEAGLADVELGLEDRSWRSLNISSEIEFTRAGLLQAARLSRVMAVVNPLIRRGLNLRAAYIWGDGGVQITARATGQNDDNTAEQDVNAVIQAFLDDKATRKTLTSAVARERNERTLGTDGMIAVALFTKPLTGRVQPRLIPTNQIADVITNPDDDSEVWFYKRTWSPKAGETRTAYYPDVDFRPRGPRPLRVNRDGEDRGEEIYWDAPVAFLAVNGLDDWHFGVGDAFAAIPWAKAYKEFLEDWAKLVKALSRFAWRTTSGSKRQAEKTAGAIRTAATADPTTGKTPVGGIANMSQGQVLEAIPKSGATIDSESGKPLAGMVAAGLDVPLTMLLADPGQTGARAVAETLDRPTELMAGQRRDVWADYLRTILEYVIDAAVRAPRGPLKGTVTRDEWDREVVELAGDTPRTIDFDWPDLTAVDLKTLVDAIVAADGTGKLPPLTVLKLLLQALGVDDIDEIVDEMTDDQGNFIDPEMSAGQVAVDAFNRGEDAAEALR